MGLCCMKKFDNFSSALATLKRYCRYDLNQDIILTGIVKQFEMVFELACKSMKEVMYEEGIIEAETGSPAEIIKLGYQYAYIDNQDAWEKIRKDRNVSTCLYDENESKQLLYRIINYIEEFEELKSKLLAKISNLG